MKDGVNRESIYDGKTGFTVDHERKQFDVESDPVMLLHFTDNHGGQVLLQDLVRIDTSGTKRMALREDATFYYLLLSLEDIKQYDVINRTKTLIIDKKLMLPLGMIHRQETLGKIQCLDYRIISIQVNDPSLVYDFSAKRYPDEYTRETRKLNKQLFALKGKKMPGFLTTDFHGRNFSPEQIKGKLVLLDFWEVWCGPCIESMPKVQQLYEKYKSKGLEVYGIVHEKEYLETAKQLIGKKKIGFPMLLGTETSSKSFSIVAVPTYILINKAGDIVMISEGFSPSIEEEIQKHL
jgi:thiol-disulfide isomerase/thioredoxin